MAKESPSANSSRPSRKQKESPDPGGLETVRQDASTAASKNNSGKKKTNTKPRDNTSSRGSHHKKQVAEDKVDRSIPTRPRPPSFQLLQWQWQRKKQVIRSDQYNQLRSYEAQRRITYASKLEATQLYFKSLMDLLENSVAETAKVYRLVKATAMAESQYARALTVQSPHQVPRDASSSATLLHSWQDSNTLLAATLEENSTDIEKNVSSILFAFLDAQEDQKVQYQNIGKPILEELEFMEKQVQQTWGKFILITATMNYFCFFFFHVLNNLFCPWEDAFWKTASKILDGGTSGADYHPSPSALESTAALETQKHIPNEDLWLVEMQYKMCVTLQRSTWEKRGPEIARFAAACKEMEVTRRVKLNDCMVKFLERVHALFQGIAKEDVSVSTSSASNNQPGKFTKKQLVTMPEQVTVEVESSLKGKFDSKPLPGYKDGFPMTGLENDGLLQASKVLEWKNSNAAMNQADRWRIVLAIITVDSYLHVFDLSPFCSHSLEDDEDEDLNIQLGCDPNDAIQSIFPHYILEEMNLEKVTVRRNSVIRGKMVPEFTLQLGKCDYSYQRLSIECCEVSQKSYSIGGAAIFGGHKKNPLNLFKVQFRTLSPSINNSENGTFFDTLCRNIEQG